MRDNCNPPFVPLFSGHARDDQLLVFLCRSVRLLVIAHDSSIYNFTDYSSLKLPLTSLLLTIDIIYTHVLTLAMQSRCPAMHAISGHGYYLTGKCPVTGRYHKHCKVSTTQELQVLSTQIESTDLSINTLAPLNLIRTLAPLNIRHISICLLKLSL